MNTPDRYRSAVDEAQRALAKRWQSASPADERLLRRVVALGRASAFGLDAVPGVVWARVTDYGAPGVDMAQGTCVVEVWGGRGSDARAAVQRNAPAGVSTIVVSRRATAWHRMLAWCRVTWWRMFEDPRRVL